MKKDNIFKWLYRSWGRFGLGAFIVILLIFLILSTVDFIQGGDYSGYLFLIGYLIPVSILILIYYFRRNK